MIHQTSFQVGGNKLTLETGRLANQANAAVVAKYGDTVVLSTVVMAGVRPDLDFFPLSVDYQEKLYAGGRIKGSRWVKREGKPSDEAILTSRLIDRSIRPLFPKSFKNEVQVIVTVLSVDAENDADIPAIWATAAALAISDVPWEGPVGAVRLGWAKGKEGEFMVNPTYEQRAGSALDLVVASTKDAMMMVEAGANEVEETIMLEAFKAAQQENTRVVEAIEQWVKDIGMSKASFKVDQAQVELKKLLGSEKTTIKQLIEAQASLDRVKQQGLIESLVDKYGDRFDKSRIKEVTTELVEAAVRAEILRSEKRPDGRKPQEIRPISGEVGVLPRTHGSAIFQRGSTQALTVTTLGSPALEMLIESMEGEESKRYMHHYYMPPFTVGEAGRLGWPSRREVGHGALAERALEPVIPTESEFPYTIRVVSEIMSSNGSTSMASVCGSTLSLMDAGVPIKKPVAGIAMGLVNDGKKSVVLSDIQGMEDFSGDMDFKVAGTRDGVTAMQMDVKTRGIPVEILEQALTQAKEGRLKILEEMLKVLPGPRAHISPHAPKISVVKIPEEKIGEVIGPGGRMIKKIIAETGAEINVEDDGTVTVAGMDRENIQKAVEWIKGLTREVQVGEVFEGEVKRIQPYGAFVAVSPGKEGLVHVSRMGAGFVSDPAQVVAMGQKVKVQVIRIDDMGRVDLAMMDEAGKPYGPPPGTQSGRPGGGGFRRGPRRDGGGFRPRREFHDRRR
ncbi:MAG: polyribonucleotide nucleotidyltransferase [Candidatus Chisholmbacteria bacterium]|nr:polyribonucleotide nucleotidyltransferase [Candidatus Chisholmbacteria bacterium]